MRKPLLLIGLLVGGLALILFLLVSRFTNRPADLETAPAPVQTTGTGFPIQYRDILGRNVTLATPPKRIVSLAPSMTEVLFALGAGDKIIADTTFCIHPPEAIAKEKIGGIMNPDLEKILALHPDLIVGTALTPREVVDQIDRLHLPAVFFRHTSIESVYRDIVDLSAFVDASARGNQMVSDLRARQATITKRLAGLPPERHPKVLLLLRLDGLYSAGKGTFPHELIELAGGRNIAADSVTLWPQLSMETVIAANPDVILVADSVSMEEFSLKKWERMRADPRWQQIKAVQDNRLVMVSDDLLTIPGPRLMEALEAVAAGLHPDLFPPKK